MCVIYRQLVPIERDRVKVDTLLVGTIVSTEHLRDKVHSAVCLLRLCTAA
jgi:hypothetical protein